ncbi:hypothetical protein [Pseudorhodoplanes sp.]|uniref:hypothetical protein n=1 Tax=Pseudorhodoplanes sp. TaxID=1934341 RepID=UPI002CBF43FC|nr:hypothetical protein [Pseudorhodoplanes sp.]HWV41269.1 hypothetical protein [Pseudorhodoplanes sp.]
MIGQAAGGALFLFIGLSPAGAMDGIASVYGFKGDKHGGGRTASGGGADQRPRPFVRGRVIDLSPRAAAALGFSGLAPVTISRASASGGLARQ